MTKSRDTSGLTPLSDLLGGLPLPNLQRSRARRTTTPAMTRATASLLDAAAAIQANADAAEKAYMARQLILCTLPHSDPGDVPVWTRRTGNVGLVLQPGYDLKKSASVGFPYGSLPRLLLFWIITEAVLTKCRRILLGRSLNQFLRAVGLNPDTGGGKRGDVKRLKQQMERLFLCNISFQTFATDPSGAEGKGWTAMPVAPKGELWWHPQPEQSALWESWIELGEDFFNAVVATPVPIDMRILKALKRSPLALDLYALLAYRAYSIVTRKLDPPFISWSQLRSQLGTEYATANDFQKKASAALRKISILSPGITVRMEKGGFFLHAARLDVLPAPAKGR